MSHLAIAVEPADHASASLSLYTPRIDRLVPILAGSPATGLRFVALGRSDRHLYIATTPFTHLGETEPSLLVYRSEDGLFEGRYRLGGMANVTGVQASEGLLRFVSAGTGELVALRREGPIIGPDRFTWAPTFDEATPSSGLRLHSIALHRLEVWATAHGPEGGGGPGPGGFAFNATRAAIVAAELDRPTNLISDGQSLWMLETGAARLRTIDGTRALRLPTAPRGLALLDGTLYTASGSELFAIDPRTLTVRQVTAIPGPASDLIAVEDAGHWPDEPINDWQDSHGLLLDGWCD